MTSSSKPDAPPLSRQLSETVPLKRLPSLQALRERLTDVSLPDRPSTNTVAETVNEQGEIVSRPSLSALCIPEGTGTAAPHNTAVTGGGVMAAGSPSTRLRLPPSAFTRGISFDSTRAVSGGSERSTSSSDTEQDKNSPLRRVPPSGIPRNVSSSSAGPAITLRTTGTTITHSSDPLILPTPIRVSPPTNTTNTPTSRNYVQGWKDIPTLTQIRDRVQSKASDKFVGAGTAAKEGKDAVVPKKGEWKQAEDEKHKAVQRSQEVETPITKTRNADRHPLQHHWTLYYDDTRRPPPPPTARSSLSDSSQPSELASIDALTALLAPGLDNVRDSKSNDGDEDFESRLINVGEFHTVEGYARHFNNIKPPSMLRKGANYHLFKNGIKPMYEDPANENGGKWVLVMQNQPSLLDRSWVWLTMALVGEELDPDDDICGAVVSIKPRMERIQLWIRYRGDASGGFEKVNDIGKRMMKVLELSKQDGITFDFQYNRGSLPPGHKFISVGSRYQASAAHQSTHTVDSPHSATLPRQPGTAARQMSGGSQLSGLTAVAHTPWRVSTPASAMGKPRNPFGGSLGELVRPSVPSSRASEPAVMESQEQIHKSPNGTVVSGGVRLGYRPPGPAA